MVHYVNQWRSSLLTNICVTPLSMTEHNVFRLIVVQRSFQQYTDMSITKHNLTTSYIYIYIYSMYLFITGGCMRSKCSSKWRYPWISKKIFTTKMFASKLVKHKLRWMFLIFYKLLYNMHGLCNGRVGVGLTIFNVQVNWKSVLCKMYPY